MSLKKHCDSCGSEMTERDENLVVNKDNATIDNLDFMQGETKVIQIGLLVLGKPIEVCKSCLLHFLVMEKR